MAKVISITRVEYDSGYNYWIAEYESGAKRTCGLVSQPMVDFLSYKVNKSTEIIRDGDCTTTIYKKV